MSNPGAQPLESVRIAGLSSAEAERRLREFGPNEIARESSEPAWRLLVQLGIHHIPAAQQLFGIGPLGVFDCVLSVSVGALPLMVLELSKVLRRASGTQWTAKTAAP